MTPLKKLMVKKLKPGEKTALTVRLDGPEYERLMATMYKLKQRKFQSFITRLLDLAHKHPERFDIDTDY